MWFPSLLLLLGSIFFVAGEYAMVSARRSRVESLAKQGNKNAKQLAKALENVSTFVAASQIGITMVGIGVGSVTEPYVTGLLESLFQRISFLEKMFGERGTHTFGFIVSFVLISFVLVVLGELCPKYLALRRPEQVAFLTYRPMLLFSKVLSPVIWLAQKAAGFILRMFGVNMDKPEGEAVPKEELYLLVQAGGEEGVLERTHAEMLSRALKLDVLHARDIMIHRLDMKWVDVSLSKEALLQRLKDIPFNRLPVCRGDIDDLIGILYVHDVVKHLDDEEFSIENLLRPAVAVPENLALDRIVETMRTEKTQMLIVMDEYGGTNGLVTLEDVVEEVFGELEDRLESERPVIETFSDGRVSSRAEVRLDELVSRLKLRPELGEDTRTLAQVLIDALERVPRPGDSVETEIGTLRVENMARRRITRVTVRLSPTAFESDET
jgi:CBS domain containing-hemolysin-like protein